MRARHALYPLLFAAQPVLLLYATNSTEVRFNAVVLPLLVSVACAALLVLTLLTVLRDVTRAALVASLLVIGFFSLGRAAAARGLADLPGDPRVVGSVVWGIVVTTLSVAIVRTRRSLVGVASGASLVALVLTAVPLVQLGVRWARARGEPVTTRTAMRETAAESSQPGSIRQALGAAATMPDIYYIVLDGYARSDVMRQIYGFDNAGFLDGLRQRGFQVAARSRANYCKTLHALASSLNMQYLHELMNVGSTAVDSRPLINLVRSNRAVHLLREHGYSIVAFASGYLAEFSKIDHYLVFDPGWSEFTSVLVATTPLAWFLGEQRDPHARHRQRLEYILDQIPRVREGSQPRFVFAHLLAPHPPFVFDRDGRHVPVRGRFAFFDGSDYMKHGGTVDEYVAGYAEQARWVTQRLERALDALLERYGDDPPIIIVHSDHGPGSRLDWKSVPDTDLEERFGILMAAYLPGGPAVDLGETFSPVNAFRLVFDVYFGADMGPLEHRSYYTFQSQPFRYIDVTDPQNPLEFETR
jgi:hypothetical protein